MKLELLYSDHCPNWKVAAKRFDDVAGGRGVTAERRPVTTREEAEAVEFGGSLTMLVRGEDPLASGDGRSVDLEGTVR